MQREEIVRRPEPDHIVGGPRVGIGLVFRHDLFVHLGDYLPRGIDLIDLVRCRDLVSQCLSDFPRQLERVQHLVGIKPVHAQHTGDGDVACVDPVAIPAAGSEIDHARLMLHLIALHIVEGDLPHALGEWRDIAGEARLTLRLRCGQLRQRELAIGIAQGVFRHDQWPLLKKKAPLGFCCRGFRRTRLGKNRICQQPRARASQPDGHNAQKGAAMKWDFRARCYRGSNHFDFSFSQSWANESFPSYFRMTEWRPSSLTGSAFPKAATSYSFGVSPQLKTPR